MSKNVDAMVKQATEVAGLRGQVVALTEQATKLLRANMAYSEYLGRVIGTGRGLCDAVHETWPDLAKESHKVGLPEAVRQGLLAFRRELFSIIAPDQKQEHEHEQHTTGPRLPEGAEGLAAKEDPEAPDAEELAEGEPTEEATESALPKGS